MSEDRDQSVRTDRSRWTRRRLLIASASGMSAAAIAAACGPAATPAASGSAAAGTASAVPTADVSKEPVSLTFFHYPTANQDVVPKEVVAQYMKEFPNVTVNLMSGSNGTTYPGLLASYKTTGIPTINAGYINAAVTVQGDIDGLWHTLDVKRIPHMADVFDGYRRPGDKGVGWGLSMIGIAHKKGAAGTPPSSWNDLLDPKFKGRIGLVDAPLYYYNGLYAINRIRGGTEKNMDAGFAAFAAAAKAGQFSQIFQAPQVVDLLLSGAFDVTGFSYGNVAPGIAGGQPLGFVVPKEGGIAFPLFFQIVNGSTPAQIYHSEAIIDRLLAPQNLSRYAELTLTAPASSKVTLPAALASDPAFAADAIKNAFQIDWAASAENQAAFLDRWNREVKANLR